MENSKIAKRLYRDQFKNEIIGLVSINKKSFYDNLRDNYFPFIDLIVNETETENEDEVIFDFYELGSVKFNFIFNITKNSNVVNKICLSDIKHISTNVSESVTNVDTIKHKIIENMFRKRILYTVCMKSMIREVMKTKIFPYADFTMTEHSDEMTKVDFKFGEFSLISFDFRFEPRNNTNYRLAKIS